MSSVIRTPPNCAPVVALATMLVVSTGAAQAQSCTYRIPPPSLIQFGPGLDPSVATPRTASTNASIQCTAGASSPTWIISSANGTPPRMKHATQNASIPYTVVARYVSGGTGNQLWSITATIDGAAYQNALVGSYTDDLTVQITP